MAQEKSAGRGSRTIKDVMTRNPKCVTASDNVFAVARIMRDQDIGVVPVVDGKKVIGLVTDRDIVVRGLAEGKDCGSIHVKEVMTRSVRSVKEDSTIDEVLSLMGSAEIRRVPVVNSNNEIVGIVSIGDLSKTDQDGKVGQTVEKISEAPPNK